MFLYLNPYDLILEHFLYLDLKLFLSHFNDCFSIMFNSNSQSCSLKVSEFVLQHFYSIFTAFLQHIYSIFTTYLQHIYNIFTADL